MTDLTYFAQYGKMTDPGSIRASLYRPALRRLCPCPGGSGIACAYLLGGALWIDLSEERKGEVQLRTMERRLARTLELDLKSAGTPRPNEKKIVGQLPRFLGDAGIHAAIDRASPPARAAGSGRTSSPITTKITGSANTGTRENGRWVLVDAQLDSLQCEAMKIPFNTLDVPRDQFIVGGAAWKLCRSGQADPDQFGIFDMKGLDFVKGDFIRDVASLNKIELLPWDCWGMIMTEYATLPPDDLAMLDRLADLTCVDVPDFELVRQLYESDPRLRVGESITSFVNGNPQMIAL